MEAAKKRNIAYIENVKNAPAFGLRDKIGYLCGDLGFNSLQVIVNSYLMLFCVNIFRNECSSFCRHCVYMQGVGCVK